MMTCLQHKPGSWTRSVLNYYEEAILGEFFLKVEFLEGVVCAFQERGVSTGRLLQGLGGSLNNAEFLCILLHDEACQLRTYFCILLLYLTDSVCKGQ